MHKTLTLSIAALALCVASANAQVYLDWQTAFSGYGCIGCRISDHDVAADGSVYAVASTYETLHVRKIGADGTPAWSVDHRMAESGVDFLNVHRVLAGREGEAYVLATASLPGPPSDIAIFRFEPDGTLAWERRLDGPSQGSFPDPYNPDNQWGDIDRAQDLALGPDGSLYVSATTGYHISDFWTLKLSSDGEVLWSRTFENLPGDSRRSTDVAQSIAVDCTGNVSVLGTSEYRYIPDEGEDYFVSHMTVVSYSATGDYRRGDAYGGVNVTGPIGSDPRPRDIVADCEGNVYATGSAKGASSNDYDWVVFRIDPDVSGLAWVTLHGSTVPSPQSSDDPYQLALDGVGGLYVVGQLDWGGGDSYYRYVSRLLKLSAVSGAEEWARELTVEPGTYTSRPDGLAADASGVYVADYALTADQSNPGTNIRKYDLDGEVLWGLTADLALSNGPSTTPLWNDGALVLDGRGGLVLRSTGGDGSIHDRGLELVRFAQGERPAPLTLEAIDGPAEVEPGAEAAFTLTARAGEEVLTTFELDVEISLAGAPLHAEVVEGSDGTYAFAVPGDAAPGQTLAFVFTARAPGHEPSAPVEVEVPVVAPRARAEVQIQHAAAALAASGPLEIYVDGAATPAVAVAYPSASIGLSLEAGVSHEIRARLPETGAEFTFTMPPLPAGRHTASLPPLPAGRHTASLAGIPAEALAAYAANPEGRDRALRLVLSAFGRPADGGRLAAAPLAVVHAVTDGPAVDVVTEGGVVLASGLMFGEASAAVAVPEGVHRVEVRRADTGALLEAVRFEFPADGTPVTLTLAGFLDPAANAGGPAFQVVAVDASGVADGGVVVTAAEEALGAEGWVEARPNPLTGLGAVVFRTATPGPVALTLHDALGREVVRLVGGEIGAGTHEARLDARGLAPGLYVLRLETGSDVSARRVTVLR